MELKQTDILIERMGRLRQSEMRKAAAQNGLQLVHGEILDYLSRCNKYSNTTLAVADYLGQTKGTVSQSISLLEKKGLLTKTDDAKDGRVSRLALTAEGRAVVERLNDSLPSSEEDHPLIISSLLSLLNTWQMDREHHSFGLCRTCRHNIDLGENQFKCGLTGESLKKEETQKICREHDYPAEATA